MEIKLFDHGYVKLIETWGSDALIIEAARMSTDKGFKGWGTWVCKHCKHQFGSATEPLICHMCQSNTFEYEAGDEKLLRYLWEHKHYTPFEMAGMIIEVQAPIFVFREWHRHRTQSYNELSARYTPMPDLNYVPSVDRCMLNSLTNKQAGRVKGADELSPTAAAAWLEEIEHAYKRIEDLYQWGLRIGVPKELARITIPVGRYSRMRASANLRNWLAFLTLRMDEAAQYEIREYANVVGQFIAKQFPRTWELFNEDRK